MMPIKPRARRRTDHGSQQVTHGPRLLIIEGNPSPPALLLQPLGGAGYRVTCAHSGFAGLTQARGQLFDLILLDLDLPDLDGSHIVQRLRSTSRAPIVCLTTSDTVNERVWMLKLGADDCLVKPVHPDELVARVAAHLRRRTQRGDLLRVGELWVSLEQQQARYQGKDLPLSHMEFVLLVALMRQGGGIRARDALYQAVWGKAVSANSNVLDTHLSNIRTKLRALGGYSVIRNLRGVGVGLRGGDDPLFEGL